MALGHPTSLTRQTRQTTRSETTHMSWATSRHSGTTTAPTHQHTLKHITHGATVCQRWPTSNGAATSHAQTTTLSSESSMQAYLHKTSTARSNQNRPRSYDTASINHRRVSSKTYQATATTARPTAAYLPQASRSATAALSHSHSLPKAKTTPSRSP